MHCIQDPAGACCPFAAALSGIGQGACLPIWMPARQHVSPGQHGSVQLQAGPMSVLASIAARVPAPARSHASPGPHGEAWQPCPHVASPSRGTLGVAWTRTVMGSGRVQVSMVACVSMAARKAARFRARMGPGSHDLAQAVPGSPGGSVRAWSHMGPAPAVVCRRDALTARPYVCGALHIYLVSMEALLVHNSSTLISSMSYAFALRKHMHAQTV